LKPKKLKELLKEFSQKFDDPALTEDIVQHYWLYLRKAMTNKEHFNFSLKGLGNFMINEKKLDRVLAKSHVHLKSLNPKEFKSFARYDAVLHNHEQLAKIKDMIVQENRKGITLKVNRVNAQKNKENLGE
jgi:hypothetical protein